MMDDLGKPPGITPGFVHCPAGCADWRNCADSGALAATSADKMKRLIKWRKSDTGSVSKRCKSCRLTGGLPTKCGVNSWHEVYDESCCEVVVVRVSPADADHDRIGVKEIRSRKAAPSRSAKRPGKRRDQSQTGSFRKFCVFVLGATAVAVFATNQYQVRTEATIMAKHLEAQIKNLGSSGTIHSNTVTYEQEVNGVTEKN